MNGPLVDAICGQLLEAMIEDTVGKMKIQQRSQSQSVSGGMAGLPVDSGSLPVQTISVSGSGNVSNNNHSLLCRTRSEDAASSSNEVSEAALTRSLPRI